MKFNLSEITSIIKNRRSIPPERFSQRVVHREIVENLLRNATWAPTHGNTQPWRFKVYSGSARTQLAEALGEAYLKEEDVNQVKFDRLKARPGLSSVCIVVSMSRQETEKIPVIEEVEAVACAVQNLALTATAYGISAFWSTPKCVYGESFGQWLGLGPKDQCLGIIYLGYPSEEWPQGQRRPIEYVTQWIEE
ncbi:MAG TPA: nitroreductase [Luteibaculaceae bacterium]|nr:nitroreductase [Luteibaculaceae bacterium]